MSNNYGIESIVRIDLRALCMEILDKLLLIILGGIVAGLASYLLLSTVIMLPYQSTTKIYICPQTTGSTSDYVSLEVGSLLTTDYTEMITGRDILEDTISHFELDTTYEKFVHKVSVENPTDTRIICISVSDKDPYLARNMAIYIRDRSIEMIKKSMDQDGISVIEEANLPVRHIITAKKASVIVAFVMMILFGIFVVLRYLTIDKLVTADDVENSLHLEVLGAINYEKRGRKR